MDAVISSVAALSILINQGIGDTIRVSLTPDKASSRTEEVKVRCDISDSSYGIDAYNEGHIENSIFVDIDHDLAKRSY